MNCNSVHDLYCRGPLVRVFLLEIDETVIGNPYIFVRTLCILNGNNYCIPRNSDLYLTQLYGNWRVPSNKHASTKYHRGNGLVNSEYATYWDKNYDIFECNM